MIYYYPKIEWGYRWNLLQRCLHEVGLEPNLVGDTANETYLRFERELTSQEKVNLDALMANNPQFPPNTKGTVFKIIDVWNRRSEITQAMGLEYKVFYTESVPGSGDVDQIELHFSKTLSTQERNRVTNEYSKLISIK